MQPNERIVDMATRNCPMCLNPVPFEENETATEWCPSCGADLASWKVKNAKPPTVVTCPMCQKLAPLEGNGATKSCPSCGADLTRAMPKPIQPRTWVVTKQSPEETEKTRLGLGILGALIGALIGAGAMYAFYKGAGFRFPLLGVGIGVLTGFGAKLLNKGTENTLGMISGGVAMVAVVGTLYLMYGDFPMINIISVIVSVSFAYRIASR